MITIVDYGMGNLGSILNMFRRIGAPAEISADHQQIARAQKLLLPGVGAFGSAMERINGTGLRSILDQKALVEKVPVLGICLGMQLLTDESEEGNVPGLGWIPASTKRFPHMEGIKVPHMGWNVVQPVSSHPLTADLPEEARFYFVHSYYVQTRQAEHSILRAHYGLTFDAAIACANICGAQFHPEKSHKFGMKILSNFANM